MNDSIQEDIQSLAQADLANLTDAFVPETQAVSSEKFIVFYMDDKLYAVSAAQVVEVIQPLLATPLPKVPEWLSGIINLRGKIISVVNLPKLWGNQTAFSAPKSKLILLRSENGETGVAFAVDRLSEVVNVPKVDIHPVNLTDAPYLRGRISYKSQDLWILDADKVYSYICFCLETAH
jgi:purine-binding chemotaxis protein CheW